jgi:heme O synthase-like polyprenyltransferase
MVAASLGLLRHRTRAAARRVFLASLIYLPVLLLLLVVNVPGGVLP